MFEPAPPTRRLRAGLWRVPDLQERAGQEQEPAVPAGGPSLLPLLHHLPGGALPALLAGLLLTPSWLLQLPTAGSRACLLWQLRRDRCLRSAWQPVAAASMPRCVRPSAPPPTVPARLPADARGGDHAARPGGRGGVWRRRGPRAFPGAGGGAGAAAQAEILSAPRRRPLRWSLVLVAAVPPPLLPLCPACFLPSAPPSSCT